ncbi:uncharacterized protein [Solanum tuberosum]|uniref:uncharacterized protein isoform X3 n=1 Tax=Solanum tuberosum TaxID=4113 RepID=UPI0003D26EFD|nr:PREDICTED: uncharacterized protein LOC102594031 isoform X3 [Solanum tuberosum]
MDLDFDGPSKVPTRQSRFAPKSSKLKPQPETKPKIETLPHSDSAILTKKEELSVSLAENGAVTGNDDVPLEGETTGNYLGEDEGQVTDSDHDEVVREIDVCINPSFDPSTQLYVFQYPLRAVWRPYELEERCQEVRLRPSTAEMEVDLAIDLDSKNFDRDSVHAATIKKQMLSTSWMPLPTCASGYAVGVLIGDKLHLNPVHAVVQLRPSKRNLKESELKKNVTTNNDEKSVENEDVKEKRPMGPSKKQNKPPGIEKDIGEHWLHLKYHGARSDISARYLQKMAMEEGSPVPFSMSPVDYLNAFFPGRPTDTDRLKILRTRRPEFLKAATPALKSLAVERPDLNDWKLKEHPDKKFENLYGDVVREKQATWECLGKQINDVLPGGRNRPTMKNPLNPNADIPALPSGDKPTSSSLLRTSMSEEIREALPKALQEVFRTYKVCSFQQIRQGLRKLGVSKSYPPKGAPRKAITASIDVFDAPQEEIQAVINQVAVNIHGVYVLKSSPDNPQYDTLRKVVIDLFMAEGPSAKLKKASVTEAAKLQLNRDITNVEFLKVMKELCHSEKSAWVLRSGDGKPE